MLTLLDIQLCNDVIFIAYISLYKASIKNTNVSNQYNILFALKMMLGNVEGVFTSSCSAEMLLLLAVNVDTFAA